MNSARTNHSPTHRTNKLTSMQKKILHTLGLKSCTLLQILDNCTVGTSASREHCFNALERLETLGLIKRTDLPKVMYGLTNQGLETVQTLVLEVPA